MLDNKKTQAKRKAAKLKVPQPGEDAAERKRVLNVLAQRRYRQRRREHVEKLEAQAANTSTSTSANGAVSDTHSSPAMDAPLNLQDTAHTSLPNSEELGLHNRLDLSMAADPSFACPEYFEQIPFQNGDHQLYLTDSSCLRGGREPAVTCHQQLDPFAGADIQTFSNLPNDQQVLWDTSVLLPSLPSTPLSSSESASGGLSSTSEESGNWVLASRPASASSSSSHGAGEQVQSGESEREEPPTESTELQYSFPDEANLEMLELTLLRGCMSIARRMNIQDSIWSLSSTSPFTDPSSPAMTNFHHLPPNLQPTLLQLTIPHHPVLDLLPWPTARDKLIMVLSQPVECRPPGAASPTALIDFVYDVEDGAEGVRISGNDPYSGHNWELGEKVFKSWWWVFDRDIVRRSNQLRADRGAPLLGGGGGGEVLGEVG